MKLLQKLSHENIVVSRTSCIYLLQFLNSHTTLTFMISQKYLGAETKEETSYILLEYVPGGSISSHLTKGPFNEDVSSRKPNFLSAGV